MAKGSVYSIITRKEADDQFMEGMGILKDTLIRKMLQNGADITKYIVSSGDKFDFKNQINESQDYRFLDKYKNAIPTISYIDHSVALFLNYSYKPFGLVAQQYDKIPASSPNWNQEIRISLNQYGQFIADSVVHVKLTGLRAKNPQDRVRYIDLPGARIFEEVRFENSRVIIDKYNFETYNQYLNREVHFDDREAYVSLLGQQKSYTVRITQDPLNDLFSTSRTYSNGAQTFKQEHDELDMFIPLLFFFKDYEKALPIGGLKWGQTDFVFKITDPANLIAYADFGGGGAFTTPKISVFDLYVNNLYTDPLIFSLFMNKIDKFMITTHRQVVHRLENSSDRIRLFNEIKWPIKRLSISFRPQANENNSEYWNCNSVLTANRVLEPVLAKNTSTVISGSIISATAVSAQISGALSSVDGYYNGYYFNITGGKGYNTENIELNRYYVQNYIGATNTVIPNQPWVVIPDTTTIYELYLPQLQAGQVIYYTESSPIDTIQVDLNSNIYIDTTDITLHDTYTPYKTRGIVAPRSPGSVEIFFELENHCRDLRGHYPFKDGLSFLNYTSSYITPETPVNAYITGHAVNFFYLDSNGNTKLYYP